MKEVEALLGNDEDLVQLYLTRYMITHAVSHQVPVLTHQAFETDQQHFHSAQRGR